VVAVVVDEVADLRHRAARARSSFPAGRGSSGYWCSARSDADLLVLAGLAAAASSTHSGEDTGVLPDGQDAGREAGRLGLCMSRSCRQRADLLDLPVSVMFVAAQARPRSKHETPTRHAETLKNPLSLAAECRLHAVTGIATGARVFAACPGPVGPRGALVP
jgi:hypothetical protein